jgi:hypothetical protein
MVENINITEFEVEQLESLADLLESIEFSRDNVEAKLLILLLNIESLLPKSNIFQYVVKTDIHKEEKLELGETRKNDYQEIDRLNQRIIDLNKSIEDAYREIDTSGEAIKNHYESIENINIRVADIENEIDESEWKVDIGSHEELAFNSIKQKLVIEKRIKYGNI